MTISDLYVESYDARIEEWTKVGASPYLDAQDQPTNYVHINAKNKSIGDFGFPDLTGSPSINSVVLYLYCDCGSEKIDVYVWDGSAWSAAQTFQGSGWAWRSIDISAILDTYQKVNAAKIYLKSIAIGAWSGSVQSDCAYLEVDWTGGVLHERDISESFGMGDAIARTASLGRDISESMGLGESLSRIGAFERNLAESLGVGDTITRVKDSPRDLSESFSLCDTLEAMLTSGRNIAESLGIGDSLQRIGSYGRDLAESIGIGDIVTRSLSTMRSVSESLSLGDAVEGEIVEEKKRRGWPWHYLR